MTDAADTGPTAETESAHRRPTLYAAAFAAVQALVLLLTLVVSATPWFLTHDAYPGMYQLGYGLRLKHADCEVVIYGDSTALTGLDPQIIQQVTGLKACNIAEGITIQRVVGSSFPLDSYLANNKPPRYLLAMYTPSILRPYIKPFDTYGPEGIAYALQYDHSRSMLLRLSRRGGWQVKMQDKLGVPMIVFDLWAGRMMILDLLERLHVASEPHSTLNSRAQRDARQGFWPYPLPPETHCIRQTYGMMAKDFQSYPDSVAKMRSLYTVGDTTVLINIAPVADCDELKQTYRELNAGLHDNAFEVLPISDFNDGDVHFTPEGGRQVSLEAGKQILALEQRRKSGQGVGGAR